MTDAGHKMGMYKEEGESDLAFRWRVQEALDNRPVEVAMREVETALGYRMGWLVTKLREAIEAEREEHESNMQDLLYQATGDDL